MQNLNVLGQPQSRLSVVSSALPTATHASAKATPLAPSLQSAPEAAGDVLVRSAGSGATRAAAAPAPAPAPGSDPFSDLVDDALKAAIRKAYHTNKKTLEYSEARQIIFSTIDNIDGIVECLYTGRTIKTNSAPKPENMNIEHVLPQSDGAKGEAKSDLNDIAAADYEANEKRGNLPYGNVVQVEWSKGGTKVGLDKNGVRCCEARDLYKGNVARMMFAASVDYGIAIPDGEEAVLREWAKKDPVDDAERARSARVARVQGHGNYFVDYPGLIDRIKNL